MSKNNNELKDLLRVEGVNAKGYGIIPKLVLQDQRLTQLAKLLYSYICSFAGAGQTAFPGVDKICYDLGIKKFETMKKHRDLLEKYGYLKVEQQRGKGGKFARNIYTLIQKPVEVNEKDKESENAETLDIKGFSPIPIQRESVQMGTPSDGNPLKRESKINSNYKNNKCTKNNNKALKEKENKLVEKAAEKEKNDDVVVNLNKLFKKITGYENKSFIEKKLKTYKPAYIKDKLLLLDKQKGNIKNYEGWLTKALRENFKELTTDKKQKNNPLDTLPKKEAKKLLKIMGKDLVSSIKSIYFTTLGLCIFTDKENELKKYKQQIQETLNVPGVTIAS